MQTSSSFSEVGEDYSERRLPSSLLPQHLTLKPSVFPVVVDSLRTEASDSPTPFPKLEDYFLTVFKEYPSLSTSTLHTASKMLNVLEECALAMPNLSIHFYNTSVRLLTDLRSLDKGKYINKTVLHDKIQEIYGFLAEHRYTSKEHPISKYNSFLGTEWKYKGLEELANALTKSLSSITTKNLSFLSRVLLEDEEINAVVKAYLLVMKPIEPKIDLSEDIGTAMLAFAGVQGKAVQATRQIFAYIHQHVIEDHTILEVKQILHTLSYRKIFAKERSGVGLILYEFLKCVVNYHLKFWKGRTNKNKKRRHSLASPVKKVRGSEKKRSQIGTVERIETMFENFLALKVEENGARQVVTQRKMYLKEFQEVSGVSDQVLRTLGNKFVETLENVLGS